MGGASRICQSRHLACERVFVILSGAGAPTLRPRWHLFMYGELELRIQEQMSLARRQINRDIEPQMQIAVCGLRIG